MAYKSLVLQPGIKLVPPATEKQESYPLNHQGVVCNDF